MVAATDLERLERINRTLQIIPSDIKQSTGLALRPIKALVIEPSRRLDYLAAEHVGAARRSQGFPAY